MERSNSKSVVQKLSEFRTWEAANPNWQQLSVAQLKVRDYNRYWSTLACVAWLRGSQVRCNDIFAVGDLWVQDHMRPWKLELPTCQDWRL